MTEEDRYELRIAGWLHDCGKVTTPEYVVDKATKLETIFDRVHLVDSRFEILKRDAEIRTLRAQIELQVRGEKLNEAQLAKDAAALQREKDAIDDDLRFIQACNIGGEFMTEEDQARVRRIATARLEGGGEEVTELLTEEEVYNLIIQRGTLTSEERTIINHHIVATIKMLESLPYPKHLKRVPEFAGGHHERMDGKGYPRGLTKARCRCRRG